jgi:hypothetical protein
MFLFMNKFIFLHDTYNNNNLSYKYLLLLYDDLRSHTHKLNMTNDLSYLSYLSYTLIMLRL